MISPKHLITRRWMVIRAEKRIANRQERQAFWASVMAAEDGEMKDLLKASELLGRSEGDFLERIDGNLEGELLIRWK